MPQLQRIGKYRTKVTRDAQKLTVRLFSTDIVQVNGNHVKLNQAHWHTQTTKNRINQTANQFSLGFYIYSHRGEWRVAVEEPAQDLAWGRYPEIEFTIAHSLDQGGDSEHTA